MKEDVFRLYDDLALGESEACNRCRAQEAQSGRQLSAPLSLWHLGRNYSQDQYKVLFVGKVARGNFGNDGNKWVDATDCGRDYLLGYGWHFWSYTRAIAQTLYNGTIEDNIERIAFSNLIRCNSSDTVDLTTSVTKDMCLKRVGVFPKELAILRPRNIVFYTGQGYDEYLSSLFPGQTFKDVTFADATKPCGRKEIHWWHREYRLSSGQVVRVLRTSHPERKKKSDYVNAVADWIVAPSKV